MRSNQAARLKNTHHTTSATQPSRPPITANIDASGNTTGTPNLASHCDVTIATPGHSRRDEEGRSAEKSLLMGYLPFKYACEAADELGAALNARLERQQGPVATRSVSPGLISK